MIQIYTNIKKRFQNTFKTNVKYRYFICISETAGREQLAQLQILNKAQQRQIEELERKLEDLRRNMRYVEHQHAITKGTWNRLSP